MIILDFGNGGTCLNNEDDVTEMIDGLSEVDPDRKCVIKWQLWDKGTEPQCLRLEWGLFDMAVTYAQMLGFRTTASVFDKPSLDFLLDDHDVPFVKLANRPYLRHLARYVPRGIPIIVSFPWVDDEPTDPDEWNWYTKWMCCVSEYPAKEETYTNFPEEMLRKGISDHTVGLDLWRKYHPSVWEKHYRLPDQKGPDCGPWCVTPDDLKEVLECGVTK